MSNPHCDCDRSERDAVENHCQLKKQFGAVTVQNCKSFTLKADMCDLISKNLFANPPKDW